MARPSLRLGGEHVANRLSRLATFSIPSSKARLSLCSRTRASHSSVFTSRVSFDALLKANLVADTTLSVDPISERNPGYCFVEFSSRDDAERALVSLAGFPISGRPIKVGPCNPKPATQRAEPTARSSPSRPAVRGFGDWRSERQAAAPSAEEPRSSHGAGRVTEAREVDGLRLYVGGLSKTVDADQDQQELSQVFAEFDV